MMPLLTATVLDVWIVFRVRDLVSLKGKKGKMGSKSLPQVL